MHEYKTARAIFSFFEFFAWCAFAIGVIVFLAGLGLGGRAGSDLFGRSSGLTAYIGALPGFIIMFLSILVVMFIQVGRAAVDTSERTGRLIRLSEEHLQIAKTQHQLMQQSLKAAPALAAGAPTQENARSAKPKAVFIPPKMPPEPAPAPPEPKVIEHLGRPITVTGDMFRVGKAEFASIDDARAFIETTTLTAQR